MSKILIDEATVKLALEALEMVDRDDNDRDFLFPSQCYQLDEAIAALREALAEQPAQTATYTCGVCGVSMQMEQPAPVQQEPVAWLRKSDLVELRVCNYMRIGADSPSIWAPNAPDAPSPDMELVAVYTSPQEQRKPLTDEEIKDVAASCMWWVREQDILDDAIELARAIEAAHSIKENT